METSVHSGSAGGKDGVVAREGGIFQVIVIAALREKCRKNQKG